MNRFSERALRISLCAFLLALSFWIPLDPIDASAATCYGSTCTGLFAGTGAGTTGCAAQSGTSYYYSGSAKFEGRISLTKTQTSTDRCDTGWTRVFNNSASSNLYVAGSTRYGCSNYCYDQSIESGGYPPNSQPIGPGQYVFTPMVGPRSGTPLIPCGAASSSMLGLPLGGSNPATSSSCGGVF